MGTLTKRVHKAQGPHGEARWYARAMSPFKGEAARLKFPQSFASNKSAVRASGLFQTSMHVCPLQSGQVSQVSGL